MAACIIDNAVLSGEQGRRMRRTAWRLHCFTCVESSGPASQGPESAVTLFHSHIVVMCMQKAMGQVHL